MISLQTNVDSLVAQDNLNLNSKFQSKTIQQLTSGYRINSSGDDAAGLAVANQYRDNIAEVTQGVSNANDGVSQLQIVDGGLSNISTILDRMKTLATESASGTFTGERATLDQEYQQLSTEITRQASNINLNAGGSFNTNLSVYIGGANTAGNAGVNINLGGVNNAVDSTSLGLASTSVLGGGTSFSGSPSTSLNNPNAYFLTGGSGSEAFTVNYFDATGKVQSATATVNAPSSGPGLTGTQFISELNNALTTAGVTGVTAQIGSDGTLQLSGNNMLSATVANTGATAPVAADASSLTNSALYQTSAGTFTAFTGSTQTQNLTITVGSTAHTVTLTSDTTNASEKADTIAHALNSINTQLQGSGVYAVENQAGTGIAFEGSSAFTLSQGAASGGTAGSLFSASAGTQTVTAPTPNSSSTGNADTAITAINAAIQSLGQVQGTVGAGENKLQYAISLAQSQISNFSSAESQIRDADVASDAANLTKSQVLVQTSIAAMAQANQEPQAVLKLLQG